MVRAGVELAFETMVEAGIIEESAYYESLHETPLIANTIARKKLYEMNVVISDTAEYGCYLFDQAARPILAEKIMPKITSELIGKSHRCNSCRRLGDKKAKAKMGSTCVRYKFVT